MARENDIHYLAPTLIVFGPSLTFEVAQAVYGGYRAFKLVGGTAAIVGATGTAWTTGWAIPTTAEYWPGPAKCFLAAGGVTTTVAVMNGLSQGASILSF